MLSVFIVNAEVDNRDVMINGREKIDLYGISLLEGGGGYGTQLHRHFHSPQSRRF